MKGIGYVIGGAIILSTMIGCASQQPAQSDTGKSEKFFEEKYQLLPDGRTVLCLYKEGRIGGYSSGSTPSMSCDWISIAARTK